MPAFSQNPANSALEDYIIKATALESVARNIFRANTSQCPITLPEFTAKTHRISDYPKKLQADAEALLGAKEHYIIYSTHKGPENTLQIGDILLDQNDQPAREIDKDVLNYRQAGMIRVRRNGQAFILPQRTEATCPYTVRISRSRRVKAKSKGLEITLSKGLISFAKNDDELAMIIGHEMAHLVGRDNNADAFGFTRDQSLEYAADRTGLNFAITAGYDPVIAIEFWHRLAYRKGKKNRHYIKRYEALKAYLTL